MEQLDITQLDEIQEALRTSHFSPPNWFPLGLSLGLLKPTLDTIEAEPRNNVSRCLLECLCQWLSKADKVIEKGGPTWDSLANALRNIGDIGSAEKINEIKTELSHPACQILIKNSARLSQLVLPVELLFTEGVISKETFNKLKMSGGSLVGNSFKSLRSAISTNHYKLKVFASILLQSRETAQVATDILEEYMHTFPALSPQISETSMDIVVNEHGTTPSDSTLEVAVVNVRFDEKRNFNQMRIYFGTLVNTVAHFIEAAVPSLEDLKTYLQICYDELRFQLELADSFKKVMFIVKDKNTIIDIDCLQAIVDYFNIEEAKDHIAAYKIAIEEFCEEIKLSLCCNENFKTESSSLLTCETIKFVLEWEANEYSVRHQSFVTKSL